MISEEGESYEFIEQIKPDKAVEYWMDEFDKAAQNALKKLTKEGVYYYGKMERKKWL